MLPTGSLTLRNLQRTTSINLPLLRRVVRTFLQDLLRAQDFELGIQLVNRDEMTRLNETFLRHKGATDVMAFDYAENAAPGVSGRRGAPTLHGEVFVCLEEAVRQARQFRTTWQSELVRYIIHGVLHLCGYDDRRTAQRRQMKRVENRLLRQLGDNYDLRQLSAKPNPLGSLS